MEHKNWGCCQIVSIRQNGIINNECKKWALVRRLSKKVSDIVLGSKVK